MRLIVLLAMVGSAGTALADDRDLSAAIAIAESCLASGQQPVDCVGALYRSCEEGSMGEVLGAGRGWCDAGVGYAATSVLSRVEVRFRNACLTGEAEYELFVATHRAFRNLAQSECALVRYQNRQSSGSGETIRSHCLATFSLKRAVALMDRGEPCSR